MANLWQQLQDRSGVQRANGKSDEKAECVFHIACLHQRHDEYSSEGEGTDHCHTQERKAPHWGWSDGNRRETCNIKTTCKLIFGHISILLFYYEILNGFFQLLKTN